MFRKSKKPKPGSTNTTDVGTSDPTRPYVNLGRIKAFPVEKEAGMLTIEIPVQLARKADFQISDDTPYSMAVQGDYLSAIYQMLIKNIVWWRAQHHVTCDTPAGTQVESGDPFWNDGGLFVVGPHPLETDCQHVVVFNPKHQKTSIFPVSELTKWRYFAGNTVCFQVAEDWALKAETLYTTSDQHREAAAQAETRSDYALAILHLIDAQIKNWQQTMFVTRDTPPGTRVHSSYYAPTSSDFYLVGPFPEDPDMRATVWDPDSRLHATCPWSELRLSTNHA